jgi:hypothetical protein
VAQLPDGRVWCLPQAQQLALVSVACREVAPRYHRLLLDAYCSSQLPRIAEETETPPAPEARQPQPQAQQQQHPWQPGELPGAVNGSAVEPPAQRLQDVQDDGYILINMGHHLTAAGRHMQVGRERAKPCPLSFSPTAASDHWAESRLQNKLA